MPVLKGPDHGFADGAGSPYNDDLHGFCLPFMFRPISALDEGAGR
jgi:hypothetical protein